MRNLRDYQKVRALAGWLLRNRRWLQRPGRWHARRLLHLGCGPNIFPDFVNLDFRWVPGVNVVWDLGRPLPFPAGRFEGIFTEHCLEHFTLGDLDRVLRELRRILAPGGRLRIVVPSLEKHARAYLAAIGNASPDRAAEPAALINRVFYAGHNNMAQSHWFNDGHHYMHDFHSLRASLEQAGFAAVGAKDFNQGDDPRLLVDREDRAWESLYVEAVNPAAAAPDPAPATPA